MTIFTYRRIAVALFATAMLGACAENKVGNSGFLKDYSRLSPDTEIKGQMSYRNPAKKLTDYRKFLIDPVLVHFAPSAKGRAIEPNKLKELTAYFRDTAINKISKNYQVVDKPGAGVLRIRAAITDIDETVPLLNIHPAMKLSGAGLGGASVEIEATDARSGEIVAQIVETAKGDRMSLGAGLSVFGHAKQVMDGWIDRFVMRLDKAHGMK